MTATHPHYQDDGGPILIGDAVIHNKYGKGTVRAMPSKTTDGLDIVIRCADGIKYALPENLAKDNSVAINDVRLNPDTKRIITSRKDHSPFGASQFETDWEPYFAKAIADTLNAVVEAAGE